MDFAAAGAIYVSGTSDSEASAMAGGKNDSKPPGCVGAMCRPDDPRCADGACRAAMQEELSPGSRPLRHDPLLDPAWQGEAGLPGDLPGNQRLCSHTDPRLCGGPVPHGCERSRSSTPGTRDPPRRL